MTEDDWNEKIRAEQYPWMTDDQFECFDMLCDLFGGAHHIQGKVKPCGAGIETNSRHCGFSTFDYNTLTKAVVFAHDRCIRFGIEPSGPGLLKLCLHKRHQRDGRMYERHPTLEEHANSIRGVEHRH